MASAAHGVDVDVQSATEVRPMLPRRSLWLLVACFAVLAPFLTGCGEADAMGAASLLEDPGAASLRGNGNEGSTNTYIIGAFPNLNMISYARLPDSTWRPLIVDSITSPQAIVVDQGNMRLFIADTANSAVHFVQLAIGEDGALTVGEIKTAATSVWARSLATDGVGNLYIGGRLLLPPPATGKEAVLKLDALKIATANAQPATTTAAPADGEAAPVSATTNLEEIWTKLNSKAMGGSPRLFSASALAVDPMHLFWANSAQGSESGSVVQGSMSVPSQVTSHALQALASNVETVTCLTMTANSVFYGADGWLFGFPKSQGLVCPSGTAEKDCGVISHMKKPTGMAWDGDSTIYIVDSGEGAVFSVPSGSTTPHTPRRLFAATGLQTIGVFRNTGKAQKDADSNSIWQWW